MIQMSPVSGCTTRKMAQSMFTNREFVSVQSISPPVITGMEASAKDLDAHLNGLIASYSQE
jgi:hypothetical protein